MASLSARLGALLIMMLHPQLDSCPDIMMVRPLAEILGEEKSFTILRIEGACFQGIPELNRAVSEEVGSLVAIELHLSI